MFKRKSEPTPEPTNDTPETPSSRRCGYVMASGPMYGQVVACVHTGMMLIDDTGGPRRVNLAQVLTPEIPFQTLAPESDTKEPGTWHWL